jgi:hypothetical protein
MLPVIADGLFGRLSGGYDMKVYIIVGARTAVVKFNSTLTPLGAVDLGIASFCIGGRQGLTMVI